MKQPRLIFRRPSAVARSLTISKSGPIEGENAVMRAEAIDKTGSLEIFGGGAIAVKEDDRRPFAPFEIMEPHAGDLDEPAACRISPFDASGLCAVEERQPAKNG
jgi:hypothetical protein